MAADPPSDVTILLRQARGGDAAANSELYAQVYAELRRIAGQQMARQGPNPTLQPTVLVHEAFLRMVVPDDLDLSDRTHFFATAVTVMRRILVDHHRRRTAEKRGGAAARVVGLDPDGVAAAAGDIDVLALDEALDALAALDPRKAKVVELRFFGGLKVAEVAAALEVSERTVEADWFFARAWLRRQIEGAP